MGLGLDKKSVRSDRVRIDQNSGLVRSGHIRFFGPTTCPLVSDGSLRNSSSSIFETFEGLSDYGA